VEAFQFDAPTFDVGLNSVEAAPGELVQVYSPARTVVHLMRLRHRIGEHVALAALRRYLASPGTRPGQVNPPGFGGGGVVTRARARGRQLVVDRTVRLVVGRLVLDRWHVPNGAVQAVGVVPVHPVAGDQLQVIRPRIGPSCARTRPCRGRSACRPGRCRSCRRRCRAGRDLVLKVGWRHLEAEHEPDGLRAWRGQGAVHLYDSCRLGLFTALLLERCKPGTALSGVRPEVEHDLIVGGLLRRL
jgi:hypothetical protein